MSSVDEVLRYWLEYFREAREIRRRYANWEFIKSQPIRIRIALEYYIETGDFRTAAKNSWYGSRRIPLPSKIRSKHTNNRLGKHCYASISTWIRRGR